MANVNNAVISDKAREVLAQEMRGRGTPVYVDLYRRLQRLITDGEFKKGDMLPSESELARLTGAGRTSLRSALVLLYEDGYIKTYHGRGTFVVYDTAKPDTFGGFPTVYTLPRERVRRAIGEAQVVYSQHRPNSYDAFLDNELHAGGAQLNSFVRLYAAGGTNAVLSYTYFPAAALDPSARTDDEIEAWLARYFAQNVHSVGCSFASVPAAGVRGTETRFSFDGENFLLIASTWLSAAGEPLAYCKDYYNCDAMRFKATFEIKSNEEREM
ncbi:MAG: GntR family transcriptional regulator [Oscillospiraceae bacterium]|nr:GntR family transcriptional regulator [Oscillospiraceae bacterium]